MGDKDKTKVAGGKARAASLSPEQRKEIAKKAAEERWGTNLPQSDFEGSFPVGDKEIACAVLENGTRVITQATFLRALGRSRSPKAGTGVLSTVDDLPFFLSAEALIPFINNELRRSTTPIFYRTKSGGKAVGYNAAVLPMVGEVYLKWRDSYLHAGKQPPARYQNIFAATDILMRGLAHVGIVALVDEATGYQEIRDRKALQKILDRYITDEWAKWTKTFPDEFYQELFRLKGLEYPTPNGKKPQYVGHWTNDIIYSRLAPGVKEELKKKNPRETGASSRKRKHHQYLTPDYGHPELKQLLSNVVFLMRGCNDWATFKMQLDKAQEKYGDTIEMDI